MPGKHDMIIAAVARDALGPLDFHRKGRSRLWLADHGWWVAVVEFQPSRWSKGSYLNVAAHWLWNDGGDISLDHGGRLAEFETYRSDAQFAPAVARLADMARDEAKQLGRRFSSLDRAADVLLHAARSTPTQINNHPAWLDYHAGVASALAGQSADAAEMFASVLARPALQHSIVYLAAQRMAALLADPPELKREVTGLIARRREALGFPVLDGLLTA
jgi:hypothetical protein